MNNNQFDYLIEFMLVHAKAFLQEIGEFYPYGSVRMVNSQLKTIGV